MKKVKFLYVTSGQQFSLSDKPGAPLNVRIQGEAIVVKPSTIGQAVHLSEEEAWKRVSEKDIPFNVISLSDGRPKTFNDDEDVYIN